MIHQQQHSIIHHKQFMLNHLKLKLQIQQPHYNHEYPYINVLPKQPTQIYKQKSHTQLQAIKKTQKIPFPQIRQLILMYILENNTVVDVTECQFLKEKLANENYKKYNEKVNKKLDEFSKEKQRLMKLKSVAQVYLKLRQQFLGIDFKRALIKFDGSHLSKQVNRFQKEKMAELSKKTVNAQKQRKQLQHQFNQKIIDLFNSQTPKLKQQSQQFLQKYLSVKRLALYIQQFQKALVFIMGIKHIQNKSNPSGEERLIKDVLDTSLGDVISQLQSLIESEMDNFYEWRMNCKYDKKMLVVRYEDVQIKMNNMQGDILANIYSYIPQLLYIMNRDKDKIRSKQKQLKQEYQKFIPSYYDAIEVNLFFKRQSKLNEIIDNQKQLLAEHLRINFGMMVHYSKSAHYVNAIDFNKNGIGGGRSESIRTNKGYLEQLVSKKISFVEGTINFINVQYTELYKQACENRHGIANKIQYKIEYYKQSKEDSRISTHLIESCARLLLILNRK